MNSIENRLKTRSFWLNLGSINHGIALAVIAFGCAFSDFSCQGEVMSKTLSIYTFTLLTPQLAIEVIVWMALFLVSGQGTKANHRARWLPWYRFIGTLALLACFAFWL